RAPQWGREYACPACGRPLHASAPRKRLTIPPWVGYGLGIALIGGAVVQVASDRITTTQTRSLPSVAAPEPVRLHPAFEQRVKEKIRFLAEDLRHAPNDGVLLVRLVECYLYLAVLKRDTDPRDSAQWIRHASDLLPRVRKTHEVEATFLEEDLWNLDRLTWTVLPGTRATELWGDRGNRGTRGGRARRVAPDYPDNSSDAASGLPVVGSGGARYLDAPPAAFNASPPNAPPADASSDTAITAPLRGRVRPSGARPSLATLRRQWSAHPEDPEAARRLGQSLEQFALPGVTEEARSRRPAREYLEEAAGVYLRTGRLARLRKHQGQLSLDAADIYGALRNLEQQYAAVKQAAGAMPYSAKVWRELQAASLRAGHYEENRRARQQVAEWSFPGLRPRS
ncbi:MAG TPA: hypothetical protein VK689_12655, partial [Armatimonadota bacterium]|nr:hypothetical protein [Armatimonadota bacterium]